MVFGSSYSKAWFCWLPFFLWIGLRCLEARHGCNYFRRNNVSRNHFFFSVLTFTNGVHARCKKPEKIPLRTFGSCPECSLTSLLMAFSLCILCSFTPLLLWMSRSSFDGLFDAGMLFIKDILEFYWGIGRVESCMAVIDIAEERFRCNELSVCWISFTRYSNVL